VRIVVEVGGWEHECCGPAYERDALAQLTCHIVSAPDGTAARYVESRHGSASPQTTTEVRGRVVDLHIQHADGSTEPLQRVPSGSALRGVDEDDDGHLEQPWTGVPVTDDSQRYLVTLDT
jgi:hypothetical protein